MNNSDLNDMGQIPKDGSTSPFDKLKTEVYWYYHQGETKIWLLGSLREGTDFKSQVATVLNIIRVISKLNTTLIV